MNDFSGQSDFPFADGASGPTVSRHVSMQASEWMIRLQDAEADETLLQSFQHWHDAHPDHAKAWAYLSRFNAYLNGINRPLLNQTLMMQLNKDEKTALRSAGRRRVLKALGVGAIGLGASGVLLRQTSLWDRVRADHATGAGEQRDIQLADGTKIKLNTRTAVRVHYSGEQRLVHLLYGEILVSTAALDTGGERPEENRRPFFVQARDGLLQALGTRFTVRQEDKRTSLVVLEGRVRITPMDNPEAAQIVPAGQGAHFTGMHIDMRQPFAEAQIAWTHGMMIAHEMPLPQFLDTLGRYRNGLLICDSSAAHLRVSGIYPVMDTDRVLQALERNLPIKVQRRTSYWITVSAASR